MGAKDELSVIRAEDKAIQDVLDGLGGWYEAATRVTGRMDVDRTANTGPRSRVECAVCHMIDMERDMQLTRRIDALADKRKEAERIIDQIQSSRQRTVLRLRYLQNESWLWSWRRISQRMNLSLRGVHTLHGWGLREYDRLCRKHDI